jgi:replicative DNA helicase
MWLGPLPVPITAPANWLFLTERAKEVGATTIVIDSVKDVLPNVNDEPMAGGYNQARQYALADGIEFIEVHHTRKATLGHPPTRLDDVRGSGTLTQGAGSVVSLFGRSGDTEVTLTHIKPLAGTHPPLALTLDGESGEIGLSEQTHISPLDGAFLFAGDAGLTPAEATRHIHGESATPSDLDRIRKDLERRVRRGDLTVAKEGRTRRYHLPSPSKTVDLDTVQVVTA